MKFNQLNAMKIQTKKSLGKKGQKDRRTGIKTDGPKNRHMDIRMDGKTDWTDGQKDQLKGGQTSR